MTLQFSGRSRDLRLAIHLANSYILCRLRVPLKGKKYMVLPPAYFFGRVQSIFHVR